MSWSASTEGRDKDKVTAEFTKQMDSCAVSYPAGTPEGDDVATVKARALMLLGALNLESTGYNGVRIAAHGSHSTSNGGICGARLELSITPLQLPAEVTT